MKEKDLTIQKTKSLTTKNKSSKDLIKKSTNTAIIKKTKNKNTAIAEIKQPKTKALAVKNKVTTTKANTSKTTKKNTINKNITKNKVSKTQDTPITTHAIEYFDLPYRYNETIVKLLAQTPKRLFVYWDIADSDRESYLKIFGDNFFYETTPFLKIKNETKNYSFDVEINDFANSWYININDDNCKYTIELYRKLKNTTTTINNLIITNNNIKLDNDSLYIATSNKMDAPNGKVISQKYPKIIEYRNIKTNKHTFKEIKANSSEFYKTFFKDVDNDILLTNPSSMS